MTGPIQYFGGKNNPRMRKAILEFVPPHDFYCEPFGGGAGILFAKKPAPIEVYNDLNDNLANLFFVLSDPKLYEDFKTFVSRVPVSVGLYKRYRAAFAAGAVPTDSNRARRAAMWFYVAALSFSGRWGTSFGRDLGVVEANGNKLGTVSRWQRRVERLNAVHERLANVFIECCDWRTVFERYDHPDRYGRMLFYVDPPYPHQTRAGGKGFKTYDCEMSDAVHKDLLDVLCKSRSAIILSTYPTALYSRQLEAAGWEHTEIHVTAHSVGRTMHAYRGRNAVRNDPDCHRTEVIWLNEVTLQRLGRPTRKQPLLF